MLPLNYRNQTRKVEPCCDRPNWDRWAGWDGRGSPDPRREGFAPRLLFFFKRSTAAFARGRRRSRRWRSAGGAARRAEVARAPRRPLAAAAGRCLPLAAGGARGERAAGAPAERWWSWLRFGAVPALVAARVAQLARPGRARGATRAGDTAGCVGALLRGVRESIGFG